MPTVLITGLTGFIALHMADRFLSEGYNVRGTVRSKEKGEHVLWLPAFRQAAADGRLQYCVVEDVITGDYTRAMKGVDVVLHAASPVNMSNDQTWEEIRDPAVNGTMAVHLAAAKESSVKHVVHLSSFASMCNWLETMEEQDGRVYDETSWNPITENEAARLPDTLSKERLIALGGMIGGIRYCASKKFSELAALEISRRPEVNCKLTVLCPPTVLGPTLDTITPPAQQGWSVGTFVALLAGKQAPVPPAALLNYVDVRDLAQAAIRAVERGVDGRLGVAAGHYDHQLIADRMRTLFPHLGERIPLGHLGEYPSIKGPKNTLNSAKASELLGLSYRPFDETVRGAVESISSMERM
ncbi:methylglyoxal reductase (NADPH-dependent) gre2 [Saitozyma podzolica]|uniref:Methylglyoxal reductase (NADPH-dependent) gre2 n=1 Tax=Saitozyma podzolica TaxID=1890683 RepID=A0A427XRT0_9TREE|nr:methylglyoxal reductase (NADPH-dependent) gre2 [Saitozyma podzolica]